MPGDGIGKDVMKAVWPLLEAIQLDAEYTPLDIGWEFWCAEGDPLPKRTLDTLAQSTCALMGAITSKPKNEAEKELTPKLQGRGLAYKSPVVTLRQAFDLYTNFRPCKAYRGNPLNYRDDIDIAIFRENTEGLYSGVEFHPLPPELRRSLAVHNPLMNRFRDVPDEDIAISLRVVTRKGARRIIRKAFEYAKRLGYREVTLVEKPNVLRETSGLMAHEARSIAAEYAGIELKETNIDAQMMWLVKNPNQNPIMVTSNMFGDILSDLAAQLTGGLGFAASGNIGDTFAVFEPTHGSAPKYAGHFTVNPLAMVITIKLMLDWLGEIGKALSLERAVTDAIAEGTVRTRDMGGNSSTWEMTEAVLKKFRQHP